MDSDSLYFDFMDNVFNLTGIDVYPIEVPSGVTPSIRVTPSDGYREAFKNDVTSLRTSTFDVQIFHTNIKSLLSARSSIVNRFTGFSGPLRTNGAVAKKTEIVASLPLGASDDDKVVYSSVIVVQLLD